MSELKQATPSGSTAIHPDEAALRAAIAEQVRATAGVVRLEPTLSTAGLRGAHRRGAVDGVRVACRRDEVDVDVNIATSVAHRALDVAEQLHREISVLITTQGGHPGAVTISVLAIEADPASALTA